MNVPTLELLVCPSCRGGLSLETYQGSGNQVQEGRLTCPSCQEWFRIEQGIVDLLPLTLRNLSDHARFAHRHGLAYAESSALPAAAGAPSVGVLQDLEDYEQHVGNTPFWKAIHELTFGRWMKANLKSGALVLDVGTGTARQSPLIRKWAGVLVVEGYKP